MHERDPSLHLAPLSTTTARRVPTYDAPTDKSETKKLLESK